MKERSWLRNQLEYLLVRFIFFALRHLPRRLSMAAAASLWRLIDRLVARLRKRAMRNLALCYPGVSDLERARIVDGVFQSLSRLLWVTAFISGNRLSKIDQVIDIENLSIVSEALASKRGVLFLTGHVGAWELSAIAFGRLVTPMDVVARPLDNPLLEEYLGRIRTATGNRVLGKAGIARDVLRALQQNRAVGFLVDHNVTSHDLCFVDFFGVQTSASTVFAKLAARSGAPVIPGFALWDEERQRFVLRFQEPVQITGDPESDTQRVHSTLEAVVRQHPDQWLWLHRRFKTRPPGEPSLYT